MFSQRSFQTVTTTTSVTNEDSKSLTPKKRSNWLRTSFKKAFNRKSSCSSDSSTTGKSVPNEPSLNSKKCLSDVDENDLVKQRFSDFDEHYKMSSMNAADYSLPNSPLHQQLTLNQFRKSPISPNNYHNNSVISIGNGDELEEYQRLLRDKEIKLTDVRLEAFATAHQLDQTKEENLKMRIEIEQLKSENIRMQQYLNTNQFAACIHTSQSSNSSQQQQHQSVSSSLSSPSPSSSISSSSHNSKINLSLSNSTQHVDMSTNSSSNCSIITSDLIKLNYSNEEKLKISPSSCNLIDTININDGKRVVVSIYLGDSDPFLMDTDDENAKQILIGSIGISTKTKWDALDTMIKTLFREYLTKLQSDETPPLGLGLESLNSYYVGEMPRLADDSNESSQKLPDLLPYGYLVGNHTNIILLLKDAQNSSIDSLCFDTLVPKNVMQRYISLILDHKNILFCGPNGTSKSYLARKIGEYLVKRANKDIETSIAYFNAENKTSKDLKQYLCNIVNQVALCDNNSEVPCVLILDNLNNIGNISDAFLEFFNPKNSGKTCSYVIGTINQSDVTSLNLPQNFKWVLCVNHTEPVKNYLNRVLTRRLIDHEIKFQMRSLDLEKITKWIPKLWQHVNKYIELYNSADLTLGPKLFTSFPMDYKQAQNWFIELWNNHLVPFLIETVKEGLQIYGTKNVWEDPKQWLTETMPWFHDFSVLNSLYSIEADNVGIEINQEENVRKINKCEFNQAGDDFDEDDEYPIMYKSNDNKNEISKSYQAQSSNDNDKLLNMLMRLQEATLINQQQQQQQTKRSGQFISNETDCFNLNEISSKQSSSLETTLI